MKISVIGLGLSYNDLTERHLEIIGNADVLFGGRRHLDYFPDHSGLKVEITKDLKGLFLKMETHMNAGKKIVVLASGDPLFFGIGSATIKKFGKDKVTVFPNISSVSAAFSRIGESFQDAEIISLHGRSPEPKHLRAFQSHSRIAVMTDAKYSPSVIYSMLCENHITDFHIYVLEKLGNEREAIKCFAPGVPVTGDFDSPNIMILLRNEDVEGKRTPKIFPGMPDDLFSHERGLITKPEVRVVALSKLRPETGSIMWDLGAGSGSVSIEASQYITEGRIFSVEKDENRIKDIEKNKRHFRVLNLSVIHGNLPEIMDELPDPDRIFIGGGGRHLEKIIEISSKRLSENGVMVINTVLLGSMIKSLEKLTQLGFDTDIVQIAVSYGHNMPWDVMLKSQNPVFIISGRKR